VNRSCKPIEPCWPVKSLKTREQQLQRIVSWGLLLWVPPYSGFRQKMLLDLSQDRTPAPSFGPKSSIADAPNFRFEGVRIIFILFMISWYLPALAEGENCSFVRLDQDSGPLVDVPTSNQLKADSCYTHAGGLVMTGYLQKTTPRRPPFIVAPEKIWSHILASPTDIASSIKSANNGRTCEVINLAKTIGACDRNKILDFLSRYTASQKNFFSFLSGKKAAEESFLDFRESIRKIHDVSQPLPSAEACQSLRKGLSKIGVSETEIQSILAVTQSAAPSADHLFDLVLNSVCRQQDAWMPPIAASKSEPPVCSNFDFVPASNGSDKELQSPETFKTKLHELLDQPADKKFPIGIEYCSGIFQKSSKDYIHNRRFSANIDYLNSKENVRNFSDDCRFHASAVIGRQKIDGKCHFLIQNSHGSSCHYYENPKKCENGKIWIDQDDLAKNLIRVSHL